MADKKANPTIVLKRKELELSERKLLLQRQELRLMELEDEKATALDNIEASKAIVATFESDIAELRKISA